MFKKFKLHVSLGVLLLPILLVACAPGPAGQPATGAAVPTKIAGQPRVSVDRAQIDFGKVPMDKMVQATFVLTNAGDKPLQILGEPAVRVAKGC